MVFKMLYKWDDMHRFSSVQRSGGQFLDEALIRSNRCWASQSLGYDFLLSDSQTPSPYRQNKTWGGEENKTQRFIVSNWFQLRAGLDGAQTNTTLLEEHLWKVITQKVFIQNTDYAKMATKWRSNHLHWHYFGQQTANGRACSVSHWTEGLFVVVWTPNDSVTHLLWDLMRVQDAWHRHLDLVFFLLCLTKCWLPLLQEQIWCVLTCKLLQHRGGNIQRLAQDLSCTFKYSRFWTTAAAFTPHMVWASQTSQTTQVGPIRYSSTLFSMCAKSLLPISG